MGAPRDDLRLLSIFHWVLAALAALFSAFPVLYIVMGVLVLQGRFDDRNPPPEFLGWMMVAMGIAFTVAGLCYAALVAYAGRCVGRTRHWTFVIVIAALSCAFFPFGTVLGVFTIIVLSKPEVKALFQPQAMPAGTTPAPPT
jgi:ABC-type Fe3+ transport system permease subunit